MDKRTAFLIASLRDVLEFVKCARNIKDAGAADAAMSDADAMITGAIDKANAALRVNFKGLTRWNHLQWLYIDRPRELIRFVWFKLRGVAICEFCWDQNRVANPAQEGPYRQCVPCAEAAHEQNCR